MTTGPLGQGRAPAWGMAIAERWLKSYFNRPGHDLIDYRVFAIVSDGCIMEGISHEAASLAGHLGLGNLVWLYDNNSITIEGSTALAFSEDVAARFKSYNWHVQKVVDANDIEASGRSASEGRCPQTGETSLIIVNSHIAYGAPHKQDTRALTRTVGRGGDSRCERILWLAVDKKFYVPEEVLGYTKKAVRKGKKREAEWNRLFEEYARAFPDLARRFDMIQNHSLPEGGRRRCRSSPPTPKGGHEAIKWKDTQCPGERYPGFWAGRPI